MNKLTVLFFSRNDTEKAVDLINNIKGIADEIVVIDQSDDNKKAVLISFKKKSKMTKLKIYNAVALGYAEPLQAYAFLKCGNDWVLRLDTDERPSDALMRDIKGIINTTDSDGFAIRRYENAKIENRGTMFTWQTRLFRKSRTTYTGILHEQPNVDGKLSRLDDDAYYINHFDEFKGNAAGKYFVIKLIDNKLSYELYNKKMIEYVAKFLVRNKEDAKKTVLGKVVRYWMLFYEKILFRKPDEEISTFDYFIYNFIVEIGLQWLMARTVGNPIRMIRWAWFKAKEVKALNDAPDGEIYFEISKVVNKVGIIIYLGLDNPDVVDALTQKYKDKPQGISLLISLLKERYIDLANTH